MACAVFLASSLALGYAIWQWIAAGLGQIESLWVPRLVVIGLSLVVMAIQLGFQAFLIGILRIPFATR